MITWPSLLTLRYASARRKMNLVNRLERTYGIEASSEEEIVEIATNFFQHLFTSGGVGDLTYLLSRIVVTISPGDNRFLLSRHLEEEIYVALKEMGPTKTPRFDGFSTLFFQRYWGRMFKPTRYPLSPFLFLICNEGLLALMQLEMEEGSLRRAKASRHGPKISHLLFMDNNILFAEANFRGATMLKEILKEYERFSG
ncbi:hypothetical protein J1N35_007980 [Gossypium stocksii]|uniref:Reverse transcriptase domain-containing protein n=1 Tax=Gossypium stocksii TaxID=47602 RepID=A0A9D3W8J9_9ROSI|nr:hypothetical protein J1N35_007980 [Gossypium stocksii]